MVAVSTGKKWNDMAQARRQEVVQAAGEMIEAFS